MKKDSMIIKAADMFDIPTDIKGGLLHTEITSNRALFFENHKGIISLSEEEIEINSPDGVVRVTGARLRVSAMNDDEMRIEGDIGGIEFCKGSGK